MAFYVSLAAAIFMPIIIGHIFLLESQIKHLNSRIYKLEKRVANITNTTITRG